MKREKVKEIKNIVRHFADKYMTAQCIGVPKRELFADILTLINELESENAYKQEHIEMWFRKNEEKKMRIAELEKDLNYAKNIITWDGVTPLHKWEQEIKAKALKQFAERLKGITCEMCLKEQLHRCIDETLKEFINK